MGAINSACEGCFGKEIKPQETKKPTGSHDEKSKLLKNKPEQVPEGSAKLSQDASKDPAMQESAQNKNKKINLSHFDRKRVLGRGSFGKVYLVQKKSNGKLYALKTLKKEEVLSRGHIENALTEKNILQKADHPFVIRLRYSFQTESILYFVMDYCPGGELFMQLKKRGRFNEDTVQFYAAEVVLALQYLHDTLNIIYRDLKPENILLDSSGHIKITDFGLSKSSERANSFCGTPEYLAPEILLGKGHNRSVDWWSLGCLIYEMSAGYPPFSNKVRDQLYRDILKKQVTMPNYFSESVKDLLSKLLVRDPNQRLGAKGAEEIKAHPFFQNINWDDLKNLKIKPPIIPTLTRPDDLRNFDKEYTNEPVAETPVKNIGIINDPRNQIKNFTYVQKDLDVGSYRG